MTQIEVYPGESLDIAIKRFRKKAERDGINHALKKLAFHEKDSLKRKRKKEVIKRKLQKRLRRQQKVGRKY